MALNPSLTGGASWTQITIDFGSDPVYDKTFTVVDATVSATSKIVASESGDSASDSVLWDGLSFAAGALAGSFTLYVSANPGPVSGTRKVYYQVS